MSPLKKYCLLNSPIQLNRLDRPYNDQKRTLNQVSHQLQPMTKLLLTGLLSLHLTAFAQTSSAPVQAPGFASDSAAQILASGVRIEMVQPGTGPAPSTTDTVEVHYRGVLPSGVEFDSSYKRGTPAQFPLNGVIPCWTQAVQQMAPGARARVTCPAATAYGARGIPGIIPPNSPLIFDIELLRVLP